MNKTLTVEARGDREIVMTRDFDAPRRMVFDAWTRPELLRRWLGVRRGWELAVCEVDLRPGGGYRFVWRGPDRKDMGVSGVYREVVAPELLVNTEVFDDPWYPGESVITTGFDERAGRTTVTTVMRYQTPGARDGILAGPFKSGVAESYDRLESMLVEPGR